MRGCTACSPAGATVTVVDVWYIRDPYYSFQDVIDGNKVKSVTNLVLGAVPTPRDLDERHTKHWLSRHAVLDVVAGNIPVT